MRLLAGAGIESRASGLAGLLALCEAPELAGPRRRLSMGPRSNVLAFSREGATDPAASAVVVGRPLPARFHHHQA